MIATSACGLALTCQPQGKAKHAESLYRRAIEIDDRTRGPTDPRRVRAMVGREELYPLSLAFRP